jgi:hypothetical protein
VVTLGGIGSCYASLALYLLAFLPSYKLCDNNAEDVVMKIFPTTLHRNAKRWYDDLLDASITSMNQLEEVFLKEWGIRLGDI